MKLKAFFANAVRIAFAELRVTASPTLGVRVTAVLPGINRSVDERLKQIDLARTNLSDALTALDDLKIQAEGQKKQLDALSERLNSARLEKDAAGRELEEIRLRSVLMPRLYIKH